MDGVFWNRGKRKKWGAFARALRASERWDFWAMDEDPNQIVEWALMDPSTPDDTGAHDMPGVSPTTAGLLTSRGFDSAEDGAHRGRRLLDYYTYTLHE